MRGGYNCAYIPTVRPAKIYLAWGAGKDYYTGVGVEDAGVEDAGVEEGPPV